MDFEELSMKAYKNIELNEYASLPERYAYIQLKDLYYRYKCGDFTKDDSINKKNKIKKEYVDNLNQYNNIFSMYKEYNKNRIENETLLYELEKATNKDEIINIALKIISHCILDDMLVERFYKKTQIDF